MSIFDSYIEPIVSGAIGFGISYLTLRARFLKTEKMLQSSIEQQIKAREKERQIYALAIQQAKAALQNSQTISNQSKGIIKAVDANAKNLRVIIELLKDGKENI